MRGNDEQTGHLFSYLSPDERVPVTHPLRAIRPMTDKAPADLTLPPRRSTAPLMRAPRAMPATEAKRRPLPNQPQPHGRAGVMLATTKVMSSSNPPVSGPRSHQLDR